MIKAVAFDFGGVLAEEGFREGLRTIAVHNSLDPDDLFKRAEDLIYQTGYITGDCDESFFWNALRKGSGITASDTELRNEVLKYFILRKKMLNYVERVKSAGLSPLLLSDQTNWLDEIDGKTPFLYLFDHVFNSFHIKKSKRDPSIFRDVCSLMNIKPDEVLFIDDNIGNTDRAMNEGLRTIHFTDVDFFEREIKKYI